MRNARTAEKAHSRQRPQKVQVITMDIWQAKRWKKVLPEDCRRGLRTRFDPDASPEIKAYCKEMCKWLQYYWDFPMRVPIYFKSSEFIRAADGDKCSAIFSGPYNHSEEPYIRIAIGDYKKRVEAQQNYTLSVVSPHELTHYFQWINDIRLTEIGEERQATVYARDILEYFLMECEPEMYERLYHTKSPYSEENPQSDE